MAVAVSAVLSGCTVAGTAHARPGQAAALCVGRLTANEAAALSRAVPASLRHAMVPLGVAADGQVAYVSAWTPGFSGVAALRLRSGALRPIRRFGDPATDQADGAWSGRWLVWEQTYSLRSLDAFTVFGWDSVTGAVRRLGHSLAAPSGTAWPSPWHAPAVSGHYAAWAQGYGPGGLVELRLADLRTGLVTVVRKGHLQAPFFDGGLLVWPESDRPGALTTPHAYSVAEGRPVPVPVVLRAVRGTDFVAADGTRTAYLNPALTAMYYSPRPGSAARLVLRLPPGTEFVDLAIGPGVIAWTTTEATFLASTVAGGYVQVTPEYGYAVTGHGGVVLVADAPERKAPHPILALHAVDTVTVRPACSRRRR